MKSLLDIRQTVISHLNDFVKWPTEALLLWQGCVRTRYHTYPSNILALLAEQDIYRRNWSNDPAIHAFLLAGGERPKRHQKNFGWDIHHLYFGDSTLNGRIGTHAVKDGQHFTQSAGLIAVHPIANALCEEDSKFALLLRQQSFERFGYDPDGHFSKDTHDEFGFVRPHTTRVIYASTNA